MMGAARIRCRTTRLQAAIRTLIVRAKVRNGTSYSNDDLISTVEPHAVSAAAQPGGLRLATIWGYGSMRRKSALKAAEPLIPASVYVGLITMIFGIVLATAYLSSTTQSQRPRVYLAEEWRTTDPDQANAIKDNHSRPRSTTSRDPTKNRQVASNLMAFE